jgi:hypothetical protein
MRIPDIKIRVWLLRITIGAAKIREILLRLISETIPWGSLVNLLAESMHISKEAAQIVVDNIKDWLVAEVMENAQPGELENGGD